MGDSIMVRPGTMPEKDDAENATAYADYVRAILNTAHEVQERRVRDGLAQASDTLGDMVSEDMIHEVALHLPKGLTPEQAFALRHPAARRIDQMNADALFDAVTTAARQAAEETRQAGRDPVYKPLAS